MKVTVLPVGGAFVNGMSRNDGSAFRYGVILAEAARTSAVTDADGVEPRPADEPVVTPLPEELHPTRAKESVLKTTPLRIIRRT